MKVIIEHGYLTANEEALFIAEKFSVVRKILLINNSTSDVSVTVNRVIANEPTNMIKPALVLSAGYSLDILDPGEYIHFNKGDFIRGKASSSHVVRYSIDAEEPI